MQKIQGTIGVIGAILIGFAFSSGAASSFNITASKAKEVANTLTSIQVVVMAEGGPEVEIEEEIIIEEDNGYYVNKNIGGFPSVSAKAYVVADLDTGEIIASKKPDQVYPIASLTKLMTALVTEEEIDNLDQVNITYQAEATYGSQGRLKAGEVYSAQTMLRPLLLESSNDGAEALALHLGRGVFMKAMNDKAESIGLELTSFEDPSGLSAGNTSTASELLDLVVYINKYRRYIFDITQLKYYSEGDMTWYNNSNFRSDSNYLGGKNGYTDVADNTLVATFELPLDDDNNANRNIAIILLKGKNTEKDTRNIVSYLNRNIFYVNDYDKLVRN
jgi:D-alanyl-D-alanine carboxypeptidase (penicillin-binding protein 5/6)